MTEYVCMGQAIYKSRVAQGYVTRAGFCRKFNLPESTQQSIEYGKHDPQLKTLEPVFIALNIRYIEFDEKNGFRLIHG